MEQLKEIAARMRRPPPADALKTPKYERLYNHFIDAIEHGDWKPGERLPPEARMAEEFPVSLGTIQKALRMLVDHRIVVRRHGDGTFVAGALTTSSKLKNFKFLGDDGETLLPVYSKLLAVERRGADGPWARHFPGVDGFVYITRLFSVNLEFQAFAEAYLPAHRFGRFLEMTSAELDGSALTHMLGEQFHAPALKISNRLRQLELLDHICAAIEVAPGTVGTEWELIGRSYRDEPIFLQRFTLPPTDRQLEINVI